MVFLKQMVSIRQVILVRWRRYLLLSATVCCPFLFLKLLSAASFQANNPDFPWVVTPVEQQEIIGRLTVYDNQVAWIDHEDMAESPIMIKDLQTGEVRALIEELPCPAYSTYSSRLDMDGDWLVSVFNCGSREVQAFNLATNELVYIQPPPSAPPGQVLGFDPAIHNEKIVWFQSTLRGNADLYLYDLQNRTAISLTANGGPVVEIHPDIYDDWVVWNSYNLLTGDHSLVAYNLLSSEQITHPVVSGYPFDMFPRIYENLVVWNDIRNGSQNSDIFGYNLDTYQEFPIITDAVSQYAPYIHQDLLVYLQVIDSDYTIYAHDLVSHQTAFIYEINENTAGNPNSVYDATLYDGLIGFIEQYYKEPDIIYVAHRLPERVYLPVLRK